MYFLGKSYTWRPQLCRRIIWACLLLFSSKAYSDVQSSETYLNMAVYVTAISITLLQKNPKIKLVGSLLNQFPERFLVSKTNISIKSTGRVERSRGNAPPHPACAVSNTENFLGGSINKIIISVTNLCIFIYKKHMKMNIILLSLFNEEVKQKH